MNPDSNLQVISKRLFARKIYLWLILVLILVFSGLLVTNKNFNDKSKAFSSACPSGTVLIHPGPEVTIVAGDTDYEGCKITIESGARLIVAGKHSFASLDISTNGFLYPFTLENNVNDPNSFTNSDMLKMNLNITGDFHVSTGGYVVGTNRGYAPGQGPAPAGVIKAVCQWVTRHTHGGPQTIYVCNQNPDYGANHAGHGLFNPNPLYDETSIEPTEAGSGGDKGQPGNNEGGDTFQVGYGGGYIKIVAGSIKLEAGSVVEANGSGGRQNGSWAGASGGTIILKDQNPDSYYRGFIAATGGGCYAKGHTATSGDYCVAGPGGGGRIYIATASDYKAMFGINAVGVIARESTKPVPLGTCCTNTGPWSAGPILSVWKGWGFLADALTVSGSTNEPGQVSDKGLITIKSSALPQVKKTLSAYNINPGDPVTVTLDLTALKPSDGPIDDEILHDDAGKVFRVVGTLDNPLCTDGSRADVKENLTLTIVTINKPSCVLQNSGLYKYTIQAPL